MTSIPVDPINNSTPTFLTGNYAYQYGRYADIATTFDLTALPCTDCNLGINAAAKMPIITMTISISINVNVFIFRRIQKNYSLKFVSNEHIVTLLLALSTIYCTSEQKRSSFAIEVPHGWPVAESVSPPDLHVGMSLQPVVVACLS